MNFHATAAAVVHDAIRPGGRWLRMPGFTLMELLIVIAIMALLLALAVPSFAYVIRNNRLSNQANQLVYALNLARSEAVKRLQAVTLCKSATGADCQTTGVNWENGWMVFSDVDADQIYEVADGDTLLHINQALLSNFTLRGSTDVANAVTFLPSGFSATQGTFVICNENRIDFARATGVTLAGRVRRGGDLDKDGIPEMLSGTEITSCTAP